MKRLLFFLLFIVMAVNASAEKEWSIMDDSGIYMAVQGDYLWYYPGINLVRLNTKTMLSKVFTTDDGLGAQYLNDIEIGIDGTVWVATEGSVSYYKNDSWNYYSYEDGLFSDYIIKIAVASDGTVWFGSSDGLACFDGNSWTVFNTDNGLPHNLISALTIDHQDRVWVGTRDLDSYEARLCMYDGISWTVFEELNLSKDHISDIEEIRDGVIWIGNSYHIYKYDGTQFTEYNEINFYSENDSSDYKGILNIEAAKNGDIWITSVKGVYYFNGLTWEKLYNHAGCNIECTSDGTTYLGMERIYRYGEKLSGGIDAPKLYAPSDMQFIPLNTEMTFEWSEVSNANGYEIQFTPSEPYSDWGAMEIDEPYLRKNIVDPSGASPGVIIREFLHLW